MDNKGFEAASDGPVGGYQQGTGGEDAPPAYPQNPANYEGYSNIGVCSPQQVNDPSMLQRDPNQPPPTFHE